MKIKTNDIIKINSIQEAEELLKVYWCTTWISYICEDCGKEVKTKVGAFLIQKKMKCVSCKKKSTLLEKYGCTSSWDLAKEKNRQRLSDPGTQAKMRASCMAKHGRTSFYEKAIKTSLERYGGEENFKKIKLERSRATKMERYGDPNYVNQKKAQETNLKKYGVKNYMESEDFYNKGRGCKFIWNKIKFDSSWELAVYIYLTDHNIPFEYHPKDIFEYFTKDGKSHNYHPDFKLRCGYIEVKGEQFFENDKPKGWEEKYNLIISKKVVLLRKKEMSQYLNYVKDKYGHNYLASFKVKR